MNTQNGNSFLSDESAASASDELFRLLVEGVLDYAIFMLDADGHVLTWNAGAQRIKGYEAREILGKHFSIFYPPDAIAQNLPATELDSARRIASHEDEGWRVRKDGSLFWANAVITTLFDRHSNLRGYSIITRDLTQRRAHEEELRQSEERLRLMIEGVTDYAMFMLDVNGFITTWNPGAERIKGYSAQEIVGQHFSTFYPQDAKDSRWPDYELQIAAARGWFEEENWRVRKDGTNFWAKVTITAMRNEQSKLLGFAKLTRDLSDRKRVEQLEAEGRNRDDILDAERNARMEAQRAARIKDEFLATVSHELRSPLSAILGWTQILMHKRDALKPDDVVRGVKVIDRNARAQVQLIDDLLDLSRIMSGKIRLDLKQVSMLDVVQAAVESAQPAARAKELMLKATWVSMPTEVTVDVNRLQQVVWNLLTNAIKFTPSGGLIGVSLQLINDYVELRVTDNGIGIAPTFLPHVFDRFSQKDSSASRSHGGLGLGLAISRQLIELMGGSIRAISPGEGLGATFYVNLPMSHAVSLASFRPTAEESTERLSLPSLNGIRILVIDDEADFRELIQRMLEEQQANVTTVPSGKAALEILKGMKPSVIISDIGMPDMDGYQFMRSVRASEARGNRIPALALTAFARLEDRKNSLMAGYQAYLAKPFDTSELLLIVADLVGR